MGYAADPAGVVQSGQARELQLTTDVIEPKPTSRVTINANLDSRGGITVPPGGPGIDFTNVATYNSATSVTAIDANGKDVALTMYFQKSGPESWNVSPRQRRSRRAPTDAGPNIDSRTTQTEQPLTPFCRTSRPAPSSTGRHMPIDDLQLDSRLTQFVRRRRDQARQDGYTRFAVGVVVESTG